MAEREVEYYRRRAAEELERAGRAAHPETARVHSAMAGLYLDLIERREDPLRR